MGANLLDLVRMNMIEQTILKLLKGRVRLQDLLEFGEGGAGRQVAWPANLGLLAASVESGGNSKTAVPSIDAAIFIIVITVHEDKT